MTLRDVAILATGTPTEGGSGAKKLLAHEAIADRVAVLVTNYPNGWVKHFHDALMEEPDPDPIALEIVQNFPKRGKDGTFSPEDQAKIVAIYCDLMNKYGLEYIFLSGWMKQVMGLPANKVVNIHPGPLGEYGGEKMYGDNVHAEVWWDYFDGRIVSSAVTMHFVPSGADDAMDIGPIIAQIPVSLEGCKSQDDVGKRVNAMEHQIQWQVTEHVMNGRITWSWVQGEPVEFEDGLTIMVDGREFSLDGSQVDLASGLDAYGNTVVKAGDNASGNFKGACDAANKNTAAALARTLVKTDTGGWTTVIAPSKMPVRVKEDIDGVGTKTHIYLDMFETFCRDYRDGKMTESECIAWAKDLWVRMLHDLIAMNADDLRDGQVAVSVTNIIDINHLRWERGRIFSLSMAEAMGETIRELDIAIVAGETAILGESWSAQSYRRSAEGMGREFEQMPVSREQMIYVDRVIATYKRKLRDIENRIDLNIGGTVQGLSRHDKLYPLKEGHVLVALYERPDENGIIGPRSNGITSVRKHMTALGGDDWASMRFEDFLSHIWDEQSAKLSDDLKGECAGLTLGQIATGKTTVFNPFVARDLLGGLGDRIPVELSSIVHVTGNPGRKIHEGLRGAKWLAIEMNISQAKNPQIIQIIQRLTGMSDSEAMSYWNMGIPYVLACPVSSVEKITGMASKRWLVAQQIGIIRKKKKWSPVAIVHGVGVRKTTVEVAQ